MKAFFDSSAFAKRYIEEALSIQVAPGNGGLDFDDRKFLQILQVSVIGSQRTPVKVVGDQMILPV